LSTKGGTIIARTALSQQASHPPITPIHKPAGHGGLSTNTRAMNVEATATDLIALNGTKIPVEPSLPINHSPKSSTATTMKPVTHSGISDLKNKPEQSSSNPIHLNSKVSIVSSCDLSYCVTHLF
jgi:hypothetical protein